jgi:hypothetical protein
MEHYAGIDVSLESASLCVVDATGQIVREAKAASEPEVLIEWFRGLGFAVARIGLEAGPLSQWCMRACGMRDCRSNCSRPGTCAMPSTLMGQLRGCAEWPNWPIRRLWEQI